MSSTQIILVTYPLDMASKRLQADVGVGKDRQFTGMVNALTKIAKQDGWTGLYRGMGINILGAFVYRALYFGGFDSGKAILFPDAKRANVLGMWAFAQTITIAAGVLAYPLETIKVNLQVDACKKERLFKDSFDCWTKITKEQGIRGLYRGYHIRWVTMFGSNFALTLYNKLGLSF